MGVGGESLGTEVLGLVRTLEDERQYSPALNADDKGERLRTVSPSGCVSPASLPAQATHRWLCKPECA